MAAKIVKKELINDEIKVILLKNNSLWFFPAFAVGIDTVWNSISFYWIDSDIIFKSF